MNEPWPFEKIAKVATKNRQNRQMAEFRQALMLKVVEHQILCGEPPYSTKRQLFLMNE